jgi:hypothetical protein
MKKIFFLFSGFVFFSCLSLAQAPDWLWAKSAGGSSNDIGYSVAVDAVGNCYIVGSFSSIYDLSIDSITLTNAYAAYKDIFIAKYDINGNVIWAKSAGGTRDDVATNVEVDELGNIYVTGYFYSVSISFDSITLTKNSSESRCDLFLAKYDSNGNLLWVKYSGDQSDAIGNSLAVDASNNVILTGFMGGSSVVFDSISIVNTGLFIAKFNSSGNLIWIKNANNGIANSVSVDSYGNSYIAGQFEGNRLIIDTDTLYNTGASVFLDDICIIKFDLDGNVLWAKSALGINIDRAQSVSVDALGNIIVTGFFSSPTVIFDSITLTNTLYNDDVFLTKYDVDGNDIWAKSSKGGSNEIATSSFLDAFGNSYIAGCFRSDSITFDNITLSNTSSGHTDIFLAKFDVNGNVIWVKGGGGMSNDETNSIKIDALGNLYATGYFNSSTISFDTYNLSNVHPYGDCDIFLAKMNTANGIYELSGSNNILLFPNPSSDIITIITSEKVAIEILNIEGQIIKRLSAKEDNTSIDISGFARGLYFVKVKTKDKVIITKFIKE